jgi:hypothetical protein
LKAVAQPRAPCVDADLLTSTVVDQALIDVDASCAVDQFVSFRARAMVTADCIVAQMLAIAIRSLFQLLALVYISTTDIIIN